MLQTLRVLSVGGGGHALALSSLPALPLSFSCLSPALICSTGPVVTAVLRSDDTLW